MRSFALESASTTLPPQNRFQTEQLDRESRLKEALGVLCPVEDKEREEQEQLALQQDQKKMKQERMMQFVTNPWFLGFITFVFVAIILAAINPIFVQKKADNPYEKRKPSPVAVLVIAGVAGLAVPIIPMISNCIKHGGLKSSKPDPTASQGSGEHPGGWKATFANMFKSLKIGGEKEQ